MSHHPFFSFFFLRRVPAVIWGLVLVGFGLAGYHSMTKESLPDLEIPTFYVNTTWEGASAGMVEKSVTAKIEKEMRAIPGVKRVESASSYSSSAVVVTFEADEKVEESKQKVRQAIITAKNDLPRDVEEPKLEASSVNDIPITTVSLSGDVDITVLENLGRDLRRRLEQVPGIRKVDTIGMRKEVIHVQIMPERIKGLGVSPEAVYQAIRNGGMDAPWGRFENLDQEFTLRMDGAYNELADLERLVVERHDDSVIRLKDVAKVRLSHMRKQSRAALSWEGGPFAPVVGLSLLKAPGRDTLELTEKARQLMERVKQDGFWPRGVTWRLTGSEAEIIETELARGTSNGWQAMLAVFLVLLVLLTWREASVAAVSVPLTLLGAVAVLWAMGYTFNLLVIIGMIIALGLLVDDFILIMEGMHDAIFLRKMTFIPAVKHTLSTYAVPSFSGSITTILVFAPLAFLPGVDGKFMRVIPVSAAVCLVVSYFVSILMGPALLKPFLDRQKEHGPGLVDRISHKLEIRLADWLGRKVIPNRKRAALWLAGAIGVFILSLGAAVSMRTTLYQDEDGRTIGVSVELAEGTTLEQTEAVARRVGHIVREKPYIEHVMRVVGRKDQYSRTSFTDHLSGNHTPHIFGFACYLISGQERDELAVDYVEALQQEFTAALADQPGAKVFVNAERGGPSNADPIQVRITGPDLDMLRDMAGETGRQLASIPGVYDVRDDIGPARPELLYRPMPEALEHHGLTQTALANQMVIYMENGKVAKYQRPGTSDDLDVRLGTWWNSQDGDMAGPKNWDELARLALINSRGETVPLGAVARPHMTAAAPAILHADGKRAVTVLAKNAGIYEPEVLSQMRPIMDKMKAGWPAGYDYIFVGEEDADTTYSNMGLAFCGALLLVYCVLALLFDSLLRPLIILSTVLFAMVGVFFGFMLFGIPFSFSAAIGMVALVGIVVNDAIIVVETITGHMRSGKPLKEAARIGAADRLRPITSTTVTNFAGLTPLALSDPGWAPICQAIIFGEMTATIGAVILIPALYVLLPSKAA